VQDSRGIEKTSFAAPPTTGASMDELQQYLRESHNAGKLPNEAEFECFKRVGTENGTSGILVHHARHRGADGRPFAINNLALHDVRQGTAETQRARATA
jgi:hypothetical protein